MLATSLVTVGWVIENSLAAREKLPVPTIRVHKPEQLASAIKQAEAWMAQHQVPVVIEVILERVTNIAMGTEINNIMEFEDLAQTRADAPTAVASMLD